MIRTKKVYAGGYYLFQGEASANSCFIENLKEARLFFRLFDRYLKNFVKVHEYLLTAEGWMVQVTIRSKKKVLCAYAKKKKVSFKEEEPMEVWRIISERMRLFLSHYVRRTNRMEGRSGRKVKESYHRYFFETTKEAKGYMDKMRNQKIKLMQRKKKYRKVKTHYTIPKKEARGSIFLCLKGCKGKKSMRTVREKTGLSCLYLLDLDKIVLPNLISTTKNVHLTSKSPPNST